MDRPNILHILANDLGWGDLRFSGQAEGSRMIRLLRCFPERGADLL